MSRSFIQSAKDQPKRQSLNQFVIGRLQKFAPRLVATRARVLVLPHVTSHVSTWPGRHQSLRMCRPADSPRQHPTPQWRDYHNSPQSVAQADPLHPTVYLSLIFRISVDCPLRWSLIWRLLTGAVSPNPSTAEWWGYTKCHNIFWFHTTIHQDWPLFSFSGRSFEAVATWDLVYPSQAPR